jgi:hypothetical protein
MINLNLTDEQIISILHQIPKEKRMEIMEQLKFEEWLDSPEALNMKRESEKAVQEGRVFTIEEARERLKHHHG